MQKAIAVEHPAQTKTDTITELSFLMDRLDDSRSLVVFPIVNGVEVEITYAGTYLNSITKIGHDKHRFVIANSHDDPKLVRLAKQYGLPMQLTGEENNASIIPPNMTFKGYLYIPTKVFSDINAKLASYNMPQYSSARYLCDMVLDNEELVEDEAVSAVKLVLTDFDNQWRQGSRSWNKLFNNEPNDWMSALLVFKFHNLPFSRWFTYANKQQLIEAVASGNPYKVSDIPYDVTGISIRVSDFGIVNRGVTEYLYHYKFRPIRVILKGVRWRIGRDGIFKPFAVIETIDEQGKVIPQTPYFRYQWNDAVDPDLTPISIIPLYSYRWMIEHNLRIGDTLVVGNGVNRSFYILDIERNANSSGSEHYDFDVPTMCPHCLADIDTESGSDSADGLIDGHIKCMNENCQERRLLVFTHFIRTLLAQTGQYRHMPSEDKIRDMFGLYGPSHLADD